MQQRLTEPDDRQLTREERGDRNRRALMSLLLVCAVAMLLVSGLPSALIPPALAKMLAFASFGAASIAAFRRDRLVAGHFTQWDLAAALLALSLLAGLLTDPAAVGGAIEAIAPEAAAVPGPAGSPQHPVSPQESGPALAPPGV